MLPGGAALEMNPEVDSPEPQIHEAKAATPPPLRSHRSQPLASLEHFLHFGPSVSTLRHT